MSEVKRKKNNYYAQQNKKLYNKRGFLDAGMKGFLCTCNFCEKDCVKDAYQILNEYLDKSKENESKSSEDEKKVETKRNDEKGENNDAEEEDISTSLQKEISNLKSECGKIFQSVDTGVKNIVFIQSSVENPSELALPIIKDAFATKKRRTRFILRLLPIEFVCKAYIDVIKTKADPLFDNYFVREPKTFAIVFNRHSNSNLQRTEVIEELANLIVKKNGGNKVDLKNPELTVVIEIIRSFCLLAVVPNYFLYKKYNLAELYGIDKKDEKKDKEDDDKKDKKDENHEDKKDEDKDE